MAKKKVVLVGDIHLLSIRKNQAHKLEPFKDFPIAVEGPNECCLAFFTQATYPHH